MTDKQIAECPNGADKCPIFSDIAKMKEEIESLSAKIRTDYLTGIYNRQHLSFSLEQEIERTERTHLPTTLILIDADHFKAVNDDYGHVVGDKVIVYLSKIIKEAVRRIDIPCRYGGEEFAIILPSTPPLVGIQVAERIRSTVETSPILLDSGEELRITVSLGVDTYFHHSKINTEELIKRADKQLYQAKHQGRNKVCHDLPKYENLATVSADEKQALFNIGTSD